MELHPLWPQFLWVLTEVWPSPLIISHLPFVFWIPCGFIKKLLLCFPGLSEFGKYVGCGCSCSVCNFRPWWMVCLKGTEISHNFIGLCSFFFFFFCARYLFLRPLCQRLGHSSHVSFDCVSFHLPVHLSIWKSKYLQITLIKKMRFKL